MDKTRLGNRKSVHLIKQKSDSSRRVRSQYTVGRVPQAQLTPLRRLQRFKKLQEKLVIQQAKKSLNTRKVKFTKMENEGVVVNGVDTKVEEKVLKPRKPVISHEHEDFAVQNGGSENGINGVENGLEEKVESIRSKKSASVDRKESTPQKQLTDSPSSKRELRRREVTPKPQKEVKRRGTPQKIQTPDSIKVADAKKAVNIDEKTALGNEDKEIIEEEVTIEETVDESVVIVEEKENDNLSVNIVNETEEIVVVEKEPVTRGFFSVFRRNSNTSVEMKEACEASSSSSPSIICLGTPSADENFGSPSSEIRSRRAINSFSRFPGRNVSITSVESLKRKADDSFEERQRFAGDTESGSEKSPGWFFSRVWSPEPKKPKTNIESSTPFYKRVDQDSMAVNYNENTKLSLDDTLELQVNADIKETSSSKTPAKKWCTIM